MFPVEGENSMIGGIHVEQGSISVSSISDKLSNTRAMRGWGCTLCILAPAAIRSGSGNGPKERKDTVSQPFKSTFLMS